MTDPEVRDPGSGRNQQTLRDHNERLILTTLLRHGALAGSDIARRTGLSPQTVSVIMRGLEQDGLLHRGDPQRGRVGKPSIPMQLAPQGAYAVGLKIGRRSADLVLTDMIGGLIAERTLTYAYPMPQPIVQFLADGLAAFAVGLGPAAADRIAGIGIASPSEIWSWSETVGAPAHDLDAWQEFDFARAITDFSSLPVFLENDATAASRAEHTYGGGRNWRDYAYFFVGSFIGGGVILNHSVFDGPTGNAGAFGSLPMRRRDGRDIQLIDVASLHLLETAVRQAGRDPSVLWTPPQDWSGIEDLVAGWIDTTAEQLALASLTVCAVIDFEAVVIDGGFPADVRDRLVASTADKLSRLDLRGLTCPAVVAGSIGPNARALGAAATPILSQFFLNTHAEQGS
ncbi:transcriptional regulator, MarR family [Loktanella fryxellensis]|uniref:Transcriptional regulator, MarR family n=1 Tax=Loktanella fryxellensis TaxID=245187 RepID=A0A1H8G7I3_9RHOB|nr:ROK family transcriptional regulator [Loktanella fryxellensis]SEN39829.1 transcriptional regulator, MarR family [Loktanella fryxellensis]